MTDIVTRLRTTIMNQLGVSAEDQEPALYPNCADAANEIERLRIEIAAIAIYDGFAYDGPAGTAKPAWVPFGNSLKQDEARRLARVNASTNGPLTNE